MIRSFRRFLCFIGVLGAFITLPGHAFAVSLIRDAEIESTLRRYANPILQAAGLAPESVRIFIVNDDSINAYVAGGANIFIHTGLIEVCETPDMMIGVLAHETGHIAGGHLARGTEKLKNAQIGAILTYILGAAAGVGSGQGNIAAAVISGGQSVLDRNLMSFSRGNEQAADQAALGYLDRTNTSSAGMLRVLQLLKRKETQRMSGVDPYLLTHPLSSDRVQHVEQHVEHSKIPEGKTPGDFNQMHQRMRAKLYSFMQSPEKTLQRYPTRSKDVPSRLARAVAYYKIPDLTHATEEIDSLLKEMPKDPFLYDLKGQILFENGQNAQAMEAYSKAASLLPNSALILTSLAETEITSGDATKLQNAITHLEKSTQLDSTYNRSWRLLATAYGKAGQTGKSSLALAEEAALGNDTKLIRRHAAQAIRELPVGTPAHQRALDLKNLAQQIEDRKENE